MAQIEYLRSEVIHDFVKHMKLKLGADFFERLTRQYLDAGRYVDASVCIMKQRLFTQFDILELCVNLIDAEKVQ